MLAELNGYVAVIVDLVCFESCWFAFELLSCSIYELMGDGFWLYSLNETKLPWMNHDQDIGLDLAEFRNGRCNAKRRVSWSWIFTLAERVTDRQSAIQPEKRARSERAIFSWSTCYGCFNGVLCTARIQHRKLEALPMLCYFTFLSRTISLATCTPADCVCSAVLFSCDF